MTTLYLDTEFNGFNGELISMALVSAEGHEWYEVVEIKEPYDKWVQQHVVPILNKAPLTPEKFKDSLYDFLLQFQKDDELTIIADWPEDIKHFSNSLIMSPGYMMNTCHKLNLVIDRSLGDTATNSAIPHNALEDARSFIRTVK
jgi:hypothetical protein